VNHAQQDRLADPGRPVRTEVPGYLAGAHREAGEDDILVEREMVEQRLQIARERVVVIAARRLAGQAEAAAVIADAAVSVREQHPLLALPRVAVQRVAVDQHDRLAAAVVLVVNLDRGLVLGSNSDARHVQAPFVGWARIAGALTRSIVVPRRRCVQDL
jgi:hypothetical protein